MKILSTLFLSFLFLTQYSQDTISFKDDFDDNKNNWAIKNNDNQVLEIKDGKYYYENKGTGGLWTYKNIFIDPTKDFSIETTLTQTSGDDNSGFGLVIGLDNGDNYCVFNITSTKYFKVYDYQDTKNTELKPWTKLDIIKPMNEPNKLVIKKTGGTMFFYINDVEVFNAAYTQLKGSAYGIIIQNIKTVLIDNFIVKQNISSKINLVKNLGTGIVKENMGANVNSVYSDRLPVISPDGKILYITRSGDPRNQGEEKTTDIWMSLLNKDGNWDTIKNVGFPLNNTGNNFVISTTPDNNTLLLGNTYKLDGSAHSGGFSFSNKTVTGWSIPTEVKVKNYKNKSKYSSSCLSTNRKVLIIDAEADKTFGGNDLYVSFLNSDSTWSEPINLGSIVNTFGNEGTPFIAADDVTMYYSTNGKRGYGDNDIYVTHRLDSTWTNWSEPENLGPEINTSDWDAYFTLQASGKYGYMVSQQNAMGKEDIFRIKLPDAIKPKPVVLIYGKVIDSKTKKPLGTSIYYYDLKTGKEVGVASSNPIDGSYKIILPTGFSYSFLASKQGYMSVSDNIDLTSLNEYKEIERNLYLAPIEVGQTIRLNNIFFDFAKADILPTSFADLNRLIKILNDYPQLQIEVSGHTDNIGADAANLLLSQSRSQSVVNYLLNNSIEKTRLIAKGYGEIKPVETNLTDEGRAINRRVEFTILKK
jgi:outer membrane protein OmpA-like peptidoglycan-associated protein